jgi:hypothetical protein
LLLMLAKMESMIIMMNNIIAAGTVFFTKNIFQYSPSIPVYMISKNIDRFNKNLTTILINNYIIAQLKKLLYWGFKRGNYSWRYRYSFLKIQDWGTGFLKNMRR